MKEKMSRHIAPKKSEYRNNFLPFDYYDFCITAKENENLRYRNKLRDYLHTPFDWDEDLDIYIEPLSDKNEHLNQATQTSGARPASQPPVKVQKDVKHSHHFDKKAFQDLDSPDSNETDYNYCDHVDHHQPHKHRRNQTPKSVRKPVKDTQKSSPKEALKQNGIEINAANKINNSQAAPKPKRTQSNFIKQSKKIHLNSDREESKPQGKKSRPVEPLKNIANMSVQTPPAWTLRENKTTKKAPSNC